MSGFTEFLRGINGSVELSRLSLFLGATGFVLGSLVFQAWALRNGQEFDVTAFCLSFGPGFAALLGGGAGAIAIKDRNVASSKVIEATGSKPATPPNPAPDAKPEIAAATDHSGDATAMGDERPDYAR